MSEAGVSFFESALVCRGNGTGPTNCAFAAACRGVDSAKSRRCRPAANQGSASRRTIACAKSTSLKEVGPDQTDARRAENTKLKSLPVQLSTGKLNHRPNSAVLTEKVLDYASKSRTFNGFPQDEVGSRRPQTALTIPKKTDRVRSAKEVTKE